MKKFKFLALAALFGAMSTNASAAETVDAAAHTVGVVTYKLAHDGTNYYAQVLGVIATATDAQVATLTIGKTVTSQDIAGGGTWKVTSFADDWESATGYKDITAKTTSLSIDVTNFAAALTEKPYDGFTKLQSLTILDETAAKDAKTTTFNGGFNTAAKATLKTVSLSSNITALGDGAFQNYTALSTINLAGVKTFGSSAFNGASKLATIALDNAVTIKDGAFAHMPLVEEITIPGTVTTIGANAFKDMPKLKKLTINGTDKSTLTEIPAVFADDAALVEIVINAPKVATLATSVFPANAFTKIDMANTAITDIANLDLTGATKSLAEIKLPAALTSIPNDKFKKFEKLTTITIPEKVTSIGKNAFEESALTSITIPENVTTIGSEAFKTCKALLTVAGMDGVATLSGGMFNGCEKLQSVAIGKKVTTIDGYVFQGCKALTTVTVNSTVLNSMAGSDTFKGCETLATLDLSGTKLTTIAAGNFQGCKALKTIKLPATFTTISDWLFAETILEELNAPGVTSISAKAFGNPAADRAENKTLKKVVLGVPTTSVPAYTFANCTALEEATVGYKDAAASIADNAFYGCTGLKTFTIDATTATTAVATPPISNDAFNHCTPYVSIVTSNLYTTTYAAPKNAVYANAAAATVKTVADKGTSGKAFGILHPVVDVWVDANDAKAYSVYTDIVNGETTAYFRALKTNGGYYKIKASAHVVLKTDEPKEIALQYNTGVAIPTGDDMLFCVTADTKRAEFMATTGTGTDNLTYSTFATYGNYLYRLTNSASTGGFGFTSFTGATMKKDQFFVLFKQQPAAAGRVNMIWLDEDGNVEGEATAISTIEKAANEGAIYNLAGQKVDANFKGVVIKNGKKMIQK